MPPALPRLALIGLLTILPGLAGAQTQGAIAYAPAAGEWGWATHYRTVFGADWRALSECRGAALHGCHIAVRFRTGCGALAVGRSGWSAGAGATRAAAERDAQARCRGRTGGCAPVLAVCTP